MRIVIESIPHNKQRYPTAGDWFFENQGKTDEQLVIRVSKMSDWRYEALIAIHELAEVIQCKRDGVSQESVDEFDIAFEKQRKKSIVLSNMEPGDNRFAPYQKQHCIATGIERVLAAALDVKWQDYETEVNSL